MVNKKEKLDTDNLTICYTLINNNPKENNKKKLNKKQRFIYNFKVFNEIQAASLSCKPGYEINMEKIKNNVKEKYK